MRAIDRFLPAALSAALFGVAGMAQDNPAPQYSYPKQALQGVARKADPQCGLLTDGVKDKIQLRCEGGKEPLLVDFDFGRPVRVRGLEISLMHPNPDKRDFHPDSVKLFGSDGVSQFLRFADATLDIPFQNGPLQSVLLPLPGKGLCLKRLRVAFDTNGNGIALSELSFRLDLANEEELASAQKERLDRQVPELSTVAFLPPPPPEGRLDAGSDFFGTVGTMNSHRWFHPDNPADWDYRELKYYLPRLYDAHISCVREAFQGGFFIDKSTVAPSVAEQADEDEVKNYPRELDPKLGGGRWQEARKLTEGYLDMYSKAGIDVIPWVTVYWPKHKDYKYTEQLWSWMADLTAKHSCIKAIEFHNEPNLKFFFPAKVGDYVASCRKGAEAFRKKDKATPLVIGSMSSLWWGPAVVYMESICKLGGLDFADGWAVHPYCVDFPPEADPHYSERNDPEGREKALRAWWALMQSHNAKRKPLKLYFTEVGYNIPHIAAHMPPGSSLATLQGRQADYVSRMMMVFLESRLRGVPIETVSYYMLTGGRPGQEFEGDGFSMISGCDYGLMDTYGRPRPSYFAYAAMAKFFGKVEDFVPCELPLSFSNWPQAVKCYTWRRISDNALIIPFWRMEQRQGQDMDFAAVLSFDAIDGLPVRRIMLHDLNEPGSRAISFSVEGGRVSVPLWLTARAAWLEVELDCAAPALEKSREANKLLRDAIAKYGQTGVAPEDQALMKIMRLPAPPPPEKLK